MCWKGKKTNHQEIYDFIEKNINNDELKEFETRLENISLLDHSVYVYRFKEDMTFAEIAKKLKVDSTARVAESLTAISLAIQIYFNIVD